MVHQLFSGVDGLQTAMQGKLQMRTTEQSRNYILYKVLQT